VINKALQLYDFVNPSAELIRHNENMTYKINDNMGSYVLRIHQPIDGFNLNLLHTDMDKDAILSDEMVVLQYLEESKAITTQKVKLNVFGNAVTLLDNGVSATVLGWIEGDTLENFILTPKIASNFGAMIGKMHNVLANLTIKHRYRYDSKLLSRAIVEVNNALKQKHFSEQQAKIISDTLSYIQKYLAKSEERFIITHSDLSKSNIIYANDELIPIDFSLSGYCIPEMDLASAYAHINDDELNKGVLKGYELACGYKPDNIGIDVCFCLQILLFVVCQHNKFADESWFQDSLDRWCEKQFNPLITK
jgi:Ser/Thr protein kinase RdoA (MazF antagonist)